MARIDGGSPSADLKVASGIVTIPAVLRHAAQRWPDRRALVDSEHRINYAEYLAEVERLSRALIATGVQLGDRIAIWAPNSVEFAVAAFAVHFAGAAVVPINTRYRTLEAQDILRRSGARGLFTFCKFLGRDLLAELAGRDLPELDFSVSLHGEPSGSGIALADFARRGDSVDIRVQHDREARITGETLSELMFTSGTTGHPKGAMLCHGPSVRGFTEYARSLGLTEFDTLLGVPPFFHCFGLKACLLTAAIRGAAVVPMAVYRPADAVALIEREQVSVLQGSPTIFLDLVDLPASERSRLRSLRVAAPGASKLGAAYFRQIRDELNIHQFANGYALTEAHAVGTRVYPWDDFETAATSSGRPGPGIELRIATAGGATASAGEAGEILLRGYSLMRGYYQDAKATADAIDDDGWLHTGDVGFVDEKGRLHVNDRMTDMFIVGGFNAYPAEIETLVGRHPAIAEVAVIGVPDERLGEVGRAFVVLRPGASATAEEIIEFARGAVANFKVPRDIVFLDRLPRNANGKVTKFRLRDRTTGSVGERAGQWG